MNWKLLNLLLSSSLLITACSSSHTQEVPTQTELEDVEIGASSETTGYIYLTKPEDYIFSYARDSNSKTKFAIAVTSREQQTSPKNGLIIPSAFLFDCSTSKGMANLMKIQPAKGIQEWANKEIGEHLTTFCSAHKEFFKHSHW